MNKFERGNLPTPDSAKEVADQFNQFFSDNITRIHNDLTIL